MAKHKLTEADAEAVRVAAGFSRDAGENPEENSGPEAGDSYEALDLPNGNKLVLLGVRNGNVVGVELEPEDESDTDEAPVTTPKRRRK